MKKSKYYLFILLTMTITMILLTGCNSGSSGQDSVKKDVGDGKPSGEQVLNLIETAEIPTGDPSLATDEASFVVLGQTMEGLYAFDENGTPVPAISDGKPDVSEEGKVYTFHLRKDVEWANGDQVTANDFVYSWQRAVDPDTGSQYAYMFSGIIENATEILEGEMETEDLKAVAKDDYTLEVTLEQPVEYFDSLLAFGTYLPLNKDFVEEKGDSFGTNSDNMLANGPFKLEDWDGTGLTWKYVKNDNYYDKENVHLEEVNVQVSKEPSTSVNLFKTGKIDRTSPLSSEYAQQYQNDEHASTFKQAGTFFLKFNQKREGKDTPLANKNIRKALSMAFDKKAYTERVLADGSIPINGIIPEGFVKNPDTGEDFREENGDLMDYDVEKAKEYWKKGLDELGVDKITLELLNDDKESAKKTSEYFQDQLQSNLDGLSIEASNVPFKVLLKQAQSLDYDMVITGWGPDYMDPMTFLDLFVINGPGGTASDTNYSSKRYNELIKDAKVKYANDPVKRWDTMLEAEKLLIEKDAVVAPIYQKGKLILTKPSVKNLDEQLFGPKYILKSVYMEN